MSKTTQHIEKIDKEFIDHLNKTSEVVSEWPIWKRDILKIEIVDSPPEVAELIDNYFWELV